MQVKKGVVHILVIWISDFDIRIFHRVRYR